MTKAADTTKPMKKPAYLALFYYNVFFACISFSLILPTLAPFLTKLDAPPSYLPLAISFYSIGEMFGSLGFGGMYNALQSNEFLKTSAFGGRRRAPKVTMLVCISFGVVGSALYALAGFDPDQPKPHYILIGRAMQGIWTGGQQAVEQTYLGFASPPKQRTELTSRLGTFAVLGFILGPSVGAFFSHFFGGSDGDDENDSISMFTAPSYFILAVCISMFVATTLMWTPQVVSGKEMERRNRSVNSSLGSLGSSGETGSDSR